MRKLCLLLLLWLGAYADGTVKKAVFDLTTGDIKRFEQVVLKGTEAHTRHYEAKLKEYDAVFVIHGKAYQFFLQDLTGTPYDAPELRQRQNELATRLKSLSENYNVRFVACAAGLKARDIPESKLYPFVTTSFTSTSALIDFQDEGYAFVPVP